MLRIDQPAPQAPASRRIMNGLRGLRHLSVAFMIPAGEWDPTPVEPPKMPEWLLQFFLLNRNPPKEKAETFKEMNRVATPAEPAGFNAEKYILKKKIEKAVPNNNLIPENKPAGKFSRNDPGKLNYNPTGHPLRHFDV